jgi:hypothetical protein
MARATRPRFRPGSCPDVKGPATCTDALFGRYNPDAAEYHRDPRVGEDRVEQRRVFAVPIADQETGLASRVVQVHGEVAHRLGDPGGGRVGGCAEDPNPSGGVLDSRQHVYPGAGQGHCFEEVGGEDGLGLGAQERRPAIRCALRCRVFSTQGAPPVLPGQQAHGVGVQWGFDLASALRPVPGQVGVVGGRPALDQGVSHDVGPGWFR